MRSFAVSILVTVALAMLAGGGTYAYFSSTARSEENVFEAYTVILGSPGETEDAVLNVPDMRPGDPPASYVFDIHNDGSLAYWYGVRYLKSDDFWTCDPNDVAPRGDFELMISGEITDPGSDAPNFIVPGESEGVTVSVFLPPEANNDCMDKDGEVTIRFFAIQADWISHARLENKDELGASIIGDGIFADVHYLAWGTSLQGVVVARGLTPWKQYQLSLRGPDNGEVRSWEDFQFSTACDEPNTPMPGFEPAWECGGSWTDGFYNFVMDATASPAGELNVAFDDVRGNLASTSYNGVRLIVKEATQFSSPPYAPVLMPHYEWSDALSFNLLSY